MKESIIMALHTNPVQAFIGPRSGRLGVEVHKDGTKLATEVGVELFDHLMSLAEEHKVPFTGFFAPTQEKNPTTEVIRNWQKKNPDLRLAAVILDQKWGPSICILENNEEYSKTAKVVF